MAIDDDSEPEPDLVVVSGGPRDYPELHPATAARVVEVAGMARGFERKHKGNLYARASIPDYWVLNLVQRVLEVYRSPVPNTATPLGYSCRERLRLTEEDSITSLAFPSASIAVADLLP
jgi:Uma2 family endonuclease